MIWLYNAHNSHLQSFQNFEQLCDYFNRLEHLMSWPPLKFCNRQRWKFYYHPFNRLSALRDHCENTTTIPSKTKIYDQEFDWVELCIGDPNSLEQILITSDNDLLTLMKDWCFGYAHAHGFRILEVVVGEDFFSDSEEEFRDAMPKLTPLKRI